MEPPTDAHRKSKSDFLHAIADRLDQSCYNKQFERLVVVAPPEALGELRSTFPERLRKTVSREIPKDIAGLNATSVTSYLKRMEVI